jgi:hypothetical protein
MRDLRTSRIPITFFSIAGEFPGLEYLGLATLYTTDLTVGVVVRLLPFAIHLIVPVLAFYIFKSVGQEDTAAFFGSLFYIGNVGYFFFFSTYSYGTLGIMLFLFIALVGFEKISSEPKKAAILSLLLILSMTAIVVTHHSSSALAAILLLILAIISKAFQKRSFVFGAFLYSVVLWFTWLVYRAVNSSHYLHYNLGQRIRSFSSLVLQEFQTRELFSSSPLPLGERIVAYLYPILTLILCLFSLKYLFIGKRSNLDKLQCVRAISLAIFGPILWFAIGPLIITDNAEIVYRISPFLFLGVGYYCALYICEWSRKGNGLREVVLFASVCLVLAGGIIIGDNQAGRFRTSEIHYAAGPEVLTIDVIHAAEWLESDAGRFNRVTGDLMSSIAFAVFGMQRTDIGSNWLLFYTENPEATRGFLDKQDIDYVVVDLRDSQYPPRYRYFFNQTELYDHASETRYLDKPFPLSLLTKFDRMSSLQRIYDNGDIVIYANRLSKQALRFPVKNCTVVLAE